MVEKRSQANTRGKSSRPRGKGDSARKPAGTSPPIPFEPPAPPKTAKSEATRRRVLAAAAALFIERGFSAVSMNEVASEAGLTKGAIYGHFRSKGQLLVEAIRWKLAEQERTLEFRQRLRGGSAIDLLFDDGARDARLLQVDASAAARHDPVVAAGLIELYEERQELIRAAISQVPDPATTAWLISALSSGGAAREAVGMPFPDPERLSETLMTAMRPFVEAMQTPKEKTDRSRPRTRRSR